MGQCTGPHGGDGSRRYPPSVPRIALIAAVAALVLALAGCSVKQSGGSGGSLAPPPSGASSGDQKATAQLGFPVSATRNTTRVSGSDAVANAAGVASALYPANDATTRPQAVVLVDRSDWQG